MARAKPHTIRFPVDSQVVADIDDNFDRVFAELGASELENPVLPSQGGTGLIEYVVGDLILGATGDELTRLASIAKGGLLISQGIAVDPAWLPAGTSGQFLQTAGAGSDPAWASIAHNLLSTTHSDTTAASVVAGDLIRGTGSPAKWERLAIGGSGTFLRSDGASPSWVAIAEADIADANVLARIASNETITGSWRFNAGIGFGTAPGTDFLNLNYASGAGQYCAELRQGTATAGDSFGVMITAGTNSSDHNLRCRQLSSLDNILLLTGDGALGWGDAGTAALVMIAKSADIVQFTSVTRGDIIRGNATPAWEKLAVGGANAFLNTDGTDAKWSSTSAATQTTVGAAGLADPLPGDPEGYLLLNLGGTSYAIPFWAAS